MQNSGKLPEDGAVKEQRLKKKGSAGKRVLKIVLWIFIIALIIFATLFLASKIGQFESIGAMLRTIRGWMGI